MEPYSTLTPEQLNDALRKIFKKHLKYTSMFILGFASDLDDNTVLICGSSYNDHRKPVIMKPGGRLHKYIIEIENEEDIHFDRLDMHTYATIIAADYANKTEHRYVDEEGISIFEPRFRPMYPLGDTFYRMPILNENIMI